MADLRDGFECVPGVGRSGYGQHRDEKENGAHDDLAIREVDRHTDRRIPDDSAGTISTAILTQWYSGETPAIDAAQVETEIIGSRGRFAIFAFLMVAAGAAHLNPRNDAMTMDETRQMCLTLSAVAGLFGAVFAALRAVFPKGWFTAVAGVALTVMLLSIGVAMWHAPVPTPVSPRSPVESVAEWRASARYLDGLAASDRSRVRFVTLSPVWNRPGTPAATVADYRAALAEWVAAPVAFGGLGGREFTPVNAEKTLFAFKLDPPRAGLDADAWDSRVTKYEYGLDCSGHSDDGLRSAAVAVSAHTGTRLPVVRADWLLVRCGRSGAWRADFDRPLSAADLAAELGLSSPEPLTNWLAKNPEQVGQLELSDLAGGGRVPREKLSRTVGSFSAFQVLARALRLGIPFTRIEVR